MKNLPAYLFATAILFGTGYVVFGLGRSGWWFIPAVYVVSRINVFDD